MRCSGCSSHGRSSQIQLAKGRGVKGEEKKERRGKTKERKREEREREEGGFTYQRYFNKMCNTEYTKAGMGLTQDLCCGPVFPLNKMLVVYHAHCAATKLMLC